MSICLPFDGQDARDEVIDDVVTCDHCGTPWAEPTPR